MSKKYIMSQRSGPSQTTITIQRQNVINRLAGETDPSKIQCVKRCLALDPKKERRRITRRQNREIINRQNRESRVRREGRAVIAKKIVRTMTALEESGMPCDDQLGKLRRMLRQLYPSAKALMDEIGEPEGEPETGSMAAEAPRSETRRIVARAPSRVSTRAYSPVVELSDALADLGLPPPGELRRVESATAPIRETGRMQARAPTRVSFTSQGPQRLEDNQPPLLTKRKPAAKPVPKRVAVSMPSEPTSEEIAERRAERTQRGAPAGLFTPFTPEELERIARENQAAVPRLSNYEQIGAPWTFALFNAGHSNSFEEFGNKYAEKEFKQWLTDMGTNPPPQKDDLIVIARALMGRDRPSDFGTNPRTGKLYYPKAVDWWNKNNIHILLYILKDIYPDWVKLINSNENVSYKNYIVPLSRWVKANGFTSGIDSSAEFWRAVITYLRSKKENVRSNRLLNDWRRQHGPAARAAWNEFTQKFTSRARGHSLKEE